MNFGKLFAYLSGQGVLTNEKEVAVGNLTSGAAGAEPVQLWTLGQAPDTLSQPWTPVFLLPISPELCKQLPIT